MRVRDMHPLCCITLDHGGGGGGGRGNNNNNSTSKINKETSNNYNNNNNNNMLTAGPQDEMSVAGPLYKWTNYGKGWRSRWFLLRGDGRLSYTKILNPQNLSFLSSSLSDDVTVIGDLTSARVVRVDSCGRRSKCSSSSSKKGSNNNKSAVVHLEVRTTGMRSLYTYNVLD